MKLLKTKYYIARQDKKNQNSYEIVGGPFDKLVDTAPHISSPETRDLIVLTGAVLNHPSLRLQDKRPKKDES